jgi:hypothetical protein
MDPELDPIDHPSLILIPNVCHVPDPPYFSLQDEGDGIFLKTSAPLSLTKAFRINLIFARFTVPVSHRIVH